MMAVSPETMTFPSVHTLERELSAAVAAAARKNRHDRGNVVEDSVWQAIAFRHNFAVPGSQWCLAFDACGWKAMVDYAIQKAARLYSRRYPQQPKRRSRSRVL